MKKCYVILLFAVLLCFSSCGAGDIVSSSSPNSQVSETTSNSSNSNANTVSQPSEPEPKWEKNFDGLIECFEWHKFIDASTKSDVLSNVVGANKGYRFVSNVNGGSFNLELYYFDPKNPLENKDRIISEINTNGYFTLLDTNVQAVVSDNQKYMMVYADTSNETVKNQVYEIFKKFN